MASAVLGQADAVAFFDIARVNRRIDATACFARVQARNCYVLGPEVARFESAFADYLGARHSIGVANGTDALELSLRALDVGPKTTVLQVANAGFYTATATHAVGAQPIYVDVDVETQLMCPRALERALSTATRPACVVVTHLYGQMAPIQALAELARAHGVPLVEDCAQAHGARLDGKAAGTFGAVGCFSFYPTKNLGALGDGGALVCQDAGLADKIRALRQYGWSAKYRVTQARGRNSRLDELQAAVLHDKLIYLDEENAQRRAIADTYRAAFSHLPLTLLPAMGEASVAHLFVVQFNKRDELAAYLRDQKVASAVHYPFPDHLQPAYAESALAVRLPVTEKLAKSVLSLPCYPGMPADHVQRVVEAVSSYFRASAGGRNS